LGVLLTIPEPSYIHVEPLVDRTTALGRRSAASEAQGLPKQTPGTRAEAAIYNVESISALLLSRPHVGTIAACN
jgi:hypothetical protein